MAATAPLTLPPGTGIAPLTGQPSPVAVLRTADLTSDFLPGYFVSGTTTGQTSPDGVLLAVTVTMATGDDENRTTTEPTPAWLLMSQRDKTWKPVRPPAPALADFIADFAAKCRSPWGCLVPVKTTLLDHTDTWIYDFEMAWPNGVGVRNSYWLTLSDYQKRVVSGSPLTPADQVAADQLKAADAWQKAHPVDARTDTPVPQPDATPITSVKTPVAPAVDPVTAWIKARPWVPAAGVGGIVLLLLLIGLTHRD